MARRKKGANVTIMNYGWIPAQAEEMRKSFLVDRSQREGERKEKLTGRQAGYGLLRFTQWENGIFVSGMRRYAVSVQNSRDGF